MIVEMCRCEKCGNFYNRARVNSCPYCARKEEEEDDDKTIAVMPEPIFDDDKTVAVTEEETLYPKTAEPVEEELYPKTSEPEPEVVEEVVAPAPVEAVEEVAKPEPIVVQENVDPVVGWLVCTSGNMRGKEYRIHAENNFIGKSPKMDICLMADDKINNENHAILTYDDRDRKFYFALGEGRGIVRLNGAPLLMASELHAYDRIELGNTELIFVPLCTEKFSW